MSMDKTEDIEAATAAASKHKREQDKIDAEREVYDRILGEFTTDRDLDDYDLTDHLELFYGPDFQGNTIKITVEVVLP